MSSLKVSALFASAGFAAGILQDCQAPSCFQTTLASSSPKGSKSFEMEDMIGCVPGGRVLMHSPVTGASEDMLIQDCNAYTGPGYVLACTASSARLPYGMTDPPNPCGADCTQAQFVNFAGYSSASSGGPHGDVVLTTLASPYTPDGSGLIQVSNTTGCDNVNGQMYLLNEGQAFADVVAVSDCDVDVGGVSHVRMRQPFPTVALPATTRVAFFDSYGCSGPSAPAPSPPAPSPSCFTDEGLVHVEGRSSPVPLAQLQEGERVRDGSSYTDVIGFLHKLNANGNVVTIEHAGGELRVTPFHLLFARGEEKEAKDIAVGDELLITEGQFSEVLAVRTDETAGFNAPLTASGSLTVDGATASNYATMKGLPLAHAAMHASFFAARAAAIFFNSFAQERASKPAEQANAEAVHPLVDLYVRVLKLDDALSFLQ